MLTYPPLFTDFFLRRSVMEWYWACPYEEMGNIRDELAMKEKELSTMSTTQAMINKDRS